MHSPRHGREGDIGYHPRIRGEFSNMKSDDYSPDHLDELLDTVSDADSFIKFVAALAADRENESLKEKDKPGNPYGAGANGWEHGTIENYLDAAVRWAEGSQRLPSEPSWKTFAEFLYSGKYYE
jgi:hypothetical protein